MGRLDGISLEELHELREQTAGEIPRERVLAALGRKQGDEIERLAERHGVCEKTIRNWLDRFAERPLEQAPYDEQRSGRPAALSDGQRERLFADFNSSPAESGYDHQTWTPSLAVHHIERCFGIEYSERHVRSLLDRAAVS